MVAFSVTKEGLVNANPSYFNKFKIINAPQTNSSLFQSLPITEH